jgi:hypothetical protein
MPVDISTPPFRPLAAGEGGAHVFLASKGLDLGLAGPADPTQLRTSETSPNNVGWIDSA